MTNLFETHPISILMKFERYNGLEFFEDELRKNGYQLMPKLLIIRFLIQHAFNSQSDSATTMHNLEG